MQPRQTSLKLPRVARLACFGLALTLLATTIGSAQTPPLARYVPQQDLLVYLEFEGLDAHADTWKKTAAYKILNDTNTGAMLEDLLAQVYDKVIRPNNKTLRLTGAETVGLVKSSLQSGFLIALGGKTDNSDPNSVYGVVVFRNAFRKDTKPLFGKLVASLNGTEGKATLVTKGKHKVVSVVHPKTGPEGDWWIDDEKKEDLIISLKGSGTILILDTIDGVKPSAIEHPIRAGLSKSSPGVDVVATMFVDGAYLKNAPIPPEFGLAGLKRLDYVLGFQEKELVSVARIIAPKPRTGVLALFDQPTFTRSTLLPVPEGVQGFTVVSIDGKKVLDEILGLAKTLNPASETQIRGALDAFQAKSKIKLREDVLAQVGPRMAFYAASGKTSAGTSGFNPLSALTGGIDIPKLTVIAEVQNPAAFSRTLDALMVELNKQLRTAGPPMPAAEGDGEPKRKSDSSKSAMEFRMLPVTGGATSDRAFMMSFPAELAKFVPAYIRPTIRLSGKSLVFSIAADSAKQAADLKGGGAAAKEFADTLKQAPSGLMMVTVDDPRETLPALLAGLPGKAQALANRRKVAGDPAVGAIGAAPGGGGATDPAASGPTPRGGAGGGRGKEGLALAGEQGAGPGAAPGPGAGYPPSTPGPGQPAPADGAAGPGGNVIFSIDASKMPKAAEIKALLFPGSYSISVEDQGIRIVTREAFPNITPMFSIPALGNLPGMGGPPPGQPGGPPPPAAGVAPGAPPGGAGTGQRGARVVD